VYVTVLLILVSTRAAAQKDPFIDAFIEFHTLLSGTYGDEGPAVSAALDKMAVALSVWEAANRKAEADLKSGPGGTPANLALFYLDAGRPGDALAAIDAAIEIEPRRAGLHMFRGVVLDGIGRGAEATTSLRTAWELDPNDAVTTYLLAERLSAGPDEDLEPQAAALLATYQRTGQSPRRRAPFIEVPLVDDRAADTPQFAPAAYAEGFALFGQARYLEAITAWRAAVSRDPLVADPASSSSQLAQGIATLKQGNVAQAIEQLASAIAASSSSSEAHRVLGTAYGASRNTEKSVEQLNEALRLAPENERARVTLGRVLVEAGRTDEAERTLREGIALLPVSGRMRWALADVYERRFDGPKAIRELEAATTLVVPAGKNRLYWRLTDLAHQIFDHEHVVSALAARTRLMRNDAGAHKSLGLAYLQAGQPTHALVELITSSLLGLEDAETLAAMGRIHLNAGRYAAAEEVLRKAIAAEPASAEARYALGSTLLRLGRTEEGKQQLAEFQRLQSAQLDERRKTIELELLKRKEGLTK
jgi:tetratricopeptide (TPR) repeat protein